MQERYVSSPPVKGGLICLCRHPKRRVSQRFGIAVRDGESVRPSSCTAMFLSACIKTPPRGGVTFTHHQLVDGACCGLQLIWEIPEELRRERARLDS